MTAPSPLLRPLQGLAAVLGLAIVALLVAWTWKQPPAVTAAAPTGTVGTPDPNPAAPSRATAATPAAAAAPADARARAPAEAPAAARASAVLYGTVRSTGGEAVGRGFLWVACDGRNVGTAALQDGTFTFAGLRPGRHTLTSRIDDELPLEVEVAVQAPATRLDLRLDAKHVVTVDAVTPDGRPLVDALAGAPVATRLLRALAFATPLTGDLPPTEHAEVEGGLGPFRGQSFLPGQGKAMAKQTVGVLTLPPARSVHVALLLGTTVLAQQPVDPGQETLTFVLTADAVLAKRCAISVRFVDEHGAPVVDAPVALSSAEGTRLGTAGGPRTDANGRYRATGLVPGLIGIGVRKAGLVSPPLRYVVAAGADLDVGDVVVRAPVDVELSLANFGERGGVWLSPSDAATLAEATASSRYVAVDNGRQQKVSLYPGRYTALATASQGVAILDLDTAALPPRPIRFELRPGASLDLKPAAPGGYVQFEITTRRGAPLRRGALGNRSTYALTLPPGDYTAVVTEGNGTVRRRDFALPPGGLTLTIP